MRNFFHSILVIFFASNLECVYGKIHDLVISRDDRQGFSIESFGFKSGGVMDLDVSGFSVDTEKSVRAGFILRKADSESLAEAMLQDDLAKGKCGLDLLPPNSVLDMSNIDSVKFRHVIAKSEAGLYDLEFQRCSPTDSTLVDFEIKATFYNPGPDYLSSGQSPLPTIYAIAACGFSLAFVVWVGYMFLKRSNVQRIHYAMAVLTALYAISLFVESINLHFVKVKGKPIGFNFVFYVVAGVRGMLMFAVIVLIGTGWGLFRPFLEQREKRILIIVLPLQIVANIAAVITGETAPGSQDWVTWKDIFHLVDIICCCAILFPIVWQIRRLREASLDDGKAAFTLTKLKQFRSFYIIVVAYIYFTRIVVFLLGAVLPYNLEWVPPTFYEVTTLTFFVLTGFKFRPITNNPYLALSTFDVDGDMDTGIGIEMVEDIDQEYGLDDEDAELDDTEDAGAHAGTVSITRSGSSSDEDGSPGELGTPVEVV